MASRVKEDEKNERIIRSLLKLPENRRCINCNSLGPQYVCTNFWTFVCTNCSGIHREFTHRVKSVSMAKFTSQEVNALQEGGNQRAKEIYHKELDPQRNSFPDSSNVERLRDFIKHVYVDRRYTGERNLDKPPRAKMGEKEDSYENRRLDSYQGGSRSPPYDDTYERRYSERSSPGGRSYDGQRSPGYDLEARQYNDYKKSPGRPEIVNDWRREDRFGNGRRNDDRRISDGDSKLDAKSPERPRDLDSSSPPIVRPVRDILGDNTIPLRIIEPPKANSARAADGSVQTQRTASSSSLGSTNGNPVEVKLETSGSLIDFDADPEPAPAAAVPQPQQTTVAQSYPPPTNSTNDNNWASFDVAPEVKAPQAPANVNSLESLLSQLSVSAPGPSYVSGATGNMGAPTIAPSSSVSTFSPVGAPVPAPGLAQVFPVNGGSFLVKDPTSGQWPTMQHQQPSLYSANGIQPAAQQFIPSVDGASSNQPWNLTHAPHAQGQPSISAPQAQQDASRSGHDVSTIASQPSAGDAKPSGRRELPAFPSAASFQAALPNFQSLSRPGLVRTSRLNTPSSAWMPLQSSSYSSTVPPQAPQYASLVPPQLSSYSSAVPSQAPQYASLVPSQAPQHASRMPPSKMMLSSYSSAVPSQAPQFASRMPPRAYVVQQVPSSMPPSGQP